VYEYVYDYGVIRQSYSHSLHPESPRSASGGICDSESAIMNGESILPTYSYTYSYTLISQLYCTLPNRKSPAKPGSASFLALFYFAAALISSAVRT